MTLLRRICGKKNESEIATYVVEKIGKGFLLKTMVHNCQRLLNGLECWPLVAFQFATCRASFFVVCISFIIHFFQMNYGFILFGKFDAAILEDVLDHDAFAFFKKKGYVTQFRVRFRR